MSAIILPFQKSPPFEVRLVEKTDGSGGWTEGALDRAYALQDLISDVTRSRVTLHVDYGCGGEL